MRTVLVLIAACLLATALGLSVSQGDLTIITDPHLYSVNSEGECLDNNGEKVANQASCCNIDDTSEERIELFKVFCINTVEDEVCAKFVYHIETEVCDRAAIDRTKFYVDFDRSSIVGEPEYTSSFELQEKGKCCLNINDFDDNFEACEDP